VVLVLDVVVVVVVGGVVDVDWNGDRPALGAG
jgi:hypothetical protein